MTSGITKSSRFFFKLRVMNMSDNPRTNKGIEQCVQDNQSSAQ
jgi:hypothetical protein